MRAVKPWDFRALYLPVDKTKQFSIAYFAYQYPPAFVGWRGAWN